MVEIIDVNSSDQFSYTGPKPKQSKEDEARSMKGSSGEVKSIDGYCREFVRNFSSESSLTRPEFKRRQEDEARSMKEVLAEVKFTDELCGDREGNASNEISYEDPETSQRRSEKATSLEEPSCTKFALDNFLRNGEGGLQQEDHSLQASTDSHVCHEKDGTVSKFEGIDTGIATYNDESGSLLTALKLNAGALILSTILLRKKFDMTRKKHGRLEMPRNRKPEVSSNRLHYQALQDVDTTAQFMTKENEKTIGVLGPPLGMAIGTVFAEILNAGCSLEPGASADELEMVLKIAITEALMPVLGNECISLADKITIAFRSTYKTIASIREIRSKMPPKELQRLENVSGGSSCLLGDRVIPLTEKNLDSNLHQQMRTTKGTYRENFPGVTSGAGAVMLHNHNIHMKHQNNVMDEKNNLFLNDEEPLVLSATSESSQEKGSCFKHPRTVLGSRNAIQGDEQDMYNSPRNEDARMFEQHLKDLPYGPRSSITNQHNETGEIAQSNDMLIAESHSYQKNSNEEAENDNYSSYSPRYCDSMEDTLTCYNEDKTSSVSFNSRKASEEMGKLIVHGGSEGGGGLLVETNWQDNFLQIFGKLVQTQEHHNYIKSMELTQRIKHLTLGEEQILLSRQSNELMKEKLVFNHDKANFKRWSILEQKLISAYDELSRTCADELVAGLCIMLLSLGYGVRKYSYALLSNLIATCQPPVKEPRQTSWLNIDWLYNSLDSVTLHLRRFVCQVIAAGRLVVGLAIVAFVAQALLKWSVAGSSQAMPATIIVMILGGFCGFVGKMAVDSLGGSGKHWLLTWEILCLFHAFAACFTPLVYRLLNGSPSGKMHIPFLPPWFRRLVFHSIIVAILPILAGQLPFASFRIIVKNLYTSIISICYLPLVSIS